MEPDEDGTAELVVEAQANGFSGHASAWFTRDDIAEFAVKLGAFPIRADDAPSLEGGFWTPELEQCHVSLRVLPVNSRGTLGIQVKLARPVWAGQREGAQHLVMLEVLTENAALEQFARRVAALATGKAEEAVLESTAEMC